VACLAVTKRSAVAVFGALVVGTALGVDWHEPKKMDLAYDVRTWVGFVVAISAAVAALWQLDMPRRQLAEQKDVLKGEVERNKKRDALLTGQLQEIEQRSLTYERQQAQDVDIRASTISGPVPDMEALGGQILRTAEVYNRSSRHIRDVACRIEPPPGDSLVQAGRVGRLVQFDRARGGRVLTDQANEPQVDLARADATVEFIFPVEAEADPKARITARFTDDAGLHWQIDPDLHLEKLNSRDW
jgi:hypothetical protein